MKSILFLSLLLRFSFDLISQDAPKYTAAIEDRIKKVEKSLGGNIRIEGDPLWTLQDRMRELQLPSISIAVISNGKLEWARAYGYADLESKTPATVKTLYQAASISKSLNAIAALRLVQERKIDLNADINQYLKSWKFPYDSLSGGKKISLGNLLSHTAGLTIHGFPGYGSTDKLPTVQQVLDGLPPANTKAVRSAFPPQTKVQYSGGGTTISQLIISDVSGMTYTDYVWTRLLQPMGMLSSTYAQPPSAKHVPQLSTAYQGDGKPVPGKFHVYPEQAAAGLWTNPTDLSAYIIETINAYNGRSAKVLNQEMTKIRLTAWMGDAGLGVFLMKKGGSDYFQHGGANEGFRCQYIGDLTTGNGVVVMVNSDNGGIMNEIIAAVATVYDWKEYYKPQIREKITVSSATLDSYIGTYELEPNFKLDISNNNGTLMVLPTGQSKEILYPESDTRFFLTVVDAQVEFFKDSTGKIEKLVLYQNGQRMPAKKIR